MPDEDKAPYPRWQIEALIWGEYEHPITGEFVLAEDFTWSRIRSRVEHHGVLEGGAASMVFDLERALLALFTHNKAAAIAVLGQMFFEPSLPADLDEAVRGDPAKLIRKGTAFLHAFVNGLPVTAPRGHPSCATAYRRAR